MPKRNSPPAAGLPDMLRTYLLLTAALTATAGVLAIGWAALVILGVHAWRASNDLFVPSMGVGGMALLVASLLCLRFAGRTGRRGDAAHAIDAAAERPE